MVDYDTILRIENNNNNETTIANIYIFVMFEEVFSNKEF